MDYLGCFVEVQRILCGLFGLVCGSAANIVRIILVYLWKCSGYFEDDVDVFKCSRQYGFDVAVLWKCSGYFVYIVIFYVIYLLLSCTRKWTLD